VPLACIHCNHIVGMTYFVTCIICVDLVIFAWLCKADP